MSSASQGNNAGLCNFIANIYPYQSVKYIQVKDGRLVVLKILLMLLVMSYVVIYECWGLGGYLQSTNVVGAVRFSLQQPTINNCDPTLLECFNAFQAVNTLPYCQQYYDNDDSSGSGGGVDADDTSPAYPGNVYPCEIYDALNAQIMNEKTLVVATRVSVRNQTMTCSTPNAFNGYSCPHVYEDTTSDKEYKFYTTQAEAFTILIDHAVTASKFCTAKMKKKKNGGDIDDDDDEEEEEEDDSDIPYTCSSESSSFPGRLYSISDELCYDQYNKGRSYANFRGLDTSNAAPCYIQPNLTQTVPHQDFFSLDVLLKAAGVNLDDCHKKKKGTKKSSNGSTSCQTYRDSGATLLLNVYWNDFDEAKYEGLVEPYYYYSPQWIARSGYKQELSYYFNNNNNGDGDNKNNYRKQRTVVNMHGIEIAVLLGGEFHKWDILQLLITLTTGLGLLAVATVVVDSYMLYLLPEHEHYEHAKYNTITPDDDDENDDEGNGGENGVGDTEEFHDVANGNGDSSHPHEQQHLLGGAVPPTTTQRRPWYSLS